MSAAEIIEQIKALPPRDQHKVASFVRALTNGARVPAGDAATMDSETFAKAKTAVFQKHDEVLRRLAQ